MIIKKNPVRCLTCIQAVRLLEMRIAIFISLIPDAHVCWLSSLMADLTLHVEQVTVKESAGGQLVSVLSFSSQILFSP